MGAVKTGSQIMKLRNTFYMLALFAAMYSIAHGADDYPSRPIRIIVPSPPGGGNDIMARIGAQRLSEAWSRPVIVDNRAGAGGAIAFELVAHAEPDGYTLLLGSTNLTVLPDITKVAYDPIRDFAPVSLMSTAMNILLVHPSVPADSVRQLIALAKTQPGKLMYASSSVATSSHLAAEMFCMQAGIKMLHVPYKGNAQAMTDLMAGQESLSFPTVPSAMPHVRAKRLRALGVTGAKRAAGLPDIPTIAESGLPGYDASAWYGVLAPAGTPAAIVAKLQSEIHVALRASDIVDKLSAQGLEPAPDTAEEFARFIVAELAKWNKVIAAAGIKVE